MKILELSKLRKEFGKLVAVNDVDLSIEEGEIRGLIGPNGSGKSTLFNLITGCITTTKGKTVWKGQDITKKSTSFITQSGIARTSQANVLFGERTALQNVVMACHLRDKIGVFNRYFGQPMSSDEVRKASELLDFMGLDHVKDERASALPHGYQRRLEIAVSLGTDPELLLLDEPVSGMDPTEKQDVMGKIAKIRDMGITIILVEHDVQSVMNTCKKISVLNFGKKIAEGSPQEIRNHKDVIAAYLGGGYHRGD